MHRPPLFSVHTVYLPATSDTEKLSDDAGGAPAILESFFSREERAEFLRSIVEDATGTTRLQLTEEQAVAVLQTLLAPMTIKLFDSEWDQARQMYRSTTAGSFAPALVGSAQSGHAGTSSPATSANPATHRSD